MIYEVVEETKAYKEIICAQNWYDEDKKHAIPVGGTVIGIRVTPKEGEPRMLYYCQSCGERIKRISEDIEKSQIKLPI